MSGHHNNITQASKKRKIEQTIPHSQLLLEHINTLRETSVIFKKYDQEECFFWANDGRTARLKEGGKVLLGPLLKYFKGNADIEDIFRRKQCQDIKAEDRRWTHLESLMNLYTDHARRPIDSLKQVVDQQQQLFEPPKKLVDWIIFVLIEIFFPRDIYALATKKASECQISRSEYFDDELNIYDRDVHVPNPEWADKASLYLDIEQNACWRILLPLGVRQREIFALIMAINCLSNALSVSTLKYQNLPKALIRKEIDKYVRIHFHTLFGELFSLKTLRQVVDEAGMKADVDTDDAMQIGILARVKLRLLRANWDSARSKVFDKSRGFKLLLYNSEEHATIREVAQEYIRSKSSNVVAASDQL